MTAIPANLCTRYISVHISVLKGRAMYSMLLQYSCSSKSSVTTDVSIIMFANHTPLSFTTCASKFPKRIVDSLGSTIFYEYQVLCTSVCLCQTQGATCTTFPLWDPFINTTCQLKIYKHPHTSLGKLWLAEHESRKGFTHHPAQEMPTTCREYCLSTLTSLCSFPVSKVMLLFPTSTTVFWKDSCLRAAFKCPRITLCGVPICFHRCVLVELWASACG